MKADLSREIVDILEDLVARYPRLAGCRQDIEAAFHTLRRCFASGGKALVCGNGGSAADAEHIVGELMKGFVLKRPLTGEETGRLTAAFPTEGSEIAGKLQRALPAISLVSHTALTSAIANDTAQDMAFAQQVFGYGRQGDALIGLSTSGNAANVVNAARVARAFGLSTVCLTGAGGGLLAGICDVAIRMPEPETHLVQELTLPVYHALCLMLERAFFG
jgi:D-sedoheptulose 7-phosphate isomerase